MLHNTFQEWITVQNYICNTVLPFDLKFESVISYSYLQVVQMQHSIDVHRKNKFPVHIVVIFY